jgi:23S rRNA (pseudouridine1915-N3)-methyltransferase
MKLLIAAVGRLKDKRLEELTAEYLSRVKRHLPVEIKEVRTPDKLLRAVPAGWDQVALDEHGFELNSRELARKLEDRMNRSVKGVAFLLGGAEGLTDEVLGRVNWKLSLSRMTFPHRLTRLILAEQLYRAVSIIKGEPYHK